MLEARCRVLLLSLAVGLSGFLAATSNTLGQSGELPPGQQGESDSFTEADRIARLQSTIEVDQKALETLRALLEKRRVEEEAAGSRFQKLSDEVKSLTDQLQKAKDDGDQSSVMQFEEKIKTLQNELELSKEKFDLSIAVRKTSQEQIAALETKITQDKMVLDKLKGNEPPTVEATDEKSQTPTSSVPVDPSKEANSSTVEPSASPVSAPSTETRDTPETAAEREARKEVEKKQGKLAELEQDLEQLIESKDVLEKNIELETQTLETARKQYDNLERELETVETEFNERLNAGAATNELQQLRQRVADTQRQLSDSRTAIRDSTDRVQSLRNQLLALQTEETALVKQTEETRQQAEAAKRSEFYVKFQQYVVNTTPKVLATLVVMLILWAILKFICSRAKKWLERDDAGTKAERKHRSQTLIGVFQHTGNAVILVGGILMILDGAGIPIAPLLGGAGVVGLAVAFASQSLIKDYFCGFILLLENQFKLGDVVTINDMTGTVEQITLRIVVLRNVDGHVFFIPNGQITAVKNSTVGWARVVLDIGVAYKERVDQVTETLMQIANEFTGDAEYSELILSEPELFGVNELADSSVVVRIGLKVRPDKQWAIKRELLRRIKQRFDELGIEIPFPQRTVHHRMENENVTAIPTPQTGGERSTN